MDLGDGQVPLAEFADQIIERVLVLGENEELELGVLENALISEQLLQLHQLCLDFALLQQASLVNQFGELEDFLAQCGRINRSHDLFELIHDRLLFILRQVLKILR